MQQYVLGFAFSEDKSEILLIEKQKPEWQKGLFNGIGGKLELGESPKNAMVREFREETGVETNSDDWDFFAKLNDDGYTMYCFRIFTEDIYKAASMESEEVQRVNVEMLFDYFPIINSLKVLVPMALDQDFKYCEIDHNGKN